MEPFLFSDNPKVKLENYLPLLDEKIMLIGIHTVLKEELV